MSQQTVLRQWNEEIRKRMPHLSKPQSKALAAFSVGIAKEEGCGLNAADKKLSFAENPAAVERRIQRCRTRLGCLGVAGIGRSRSPAG